MMVDKKIASTAAACVLLSILAPGFLTAAGTDPQGDNLGVVVGFPGSIKAGEDFSVEVTITNNESESVDVRLSLYSQSKLQDNGTIDALSPGDNAQETLAGRAGEAGENVEVKVNGNLEGLRSIEGSGGGYPLVILLIVAGGLFGAGIALGYKTFGGSGEGGTPVYATPSKRNASDAEDVRREAANALDRAGSLISEVKEAGRDVSIEEELVEAAEEFHGTSEEEQSDNRFDSSYAYARAASVLGRGVSKFTESKVEAAKEAEENIAAAEEAMKEVEEGIKKAENRGIDAGSASSLNELASKIMESAPKTETAEAYRFQSETARKIVEHANNSLESSISGQEDQIGRTEERIDEADEALEGVEELIEKRRDEFDTLMAEYWQKIAEEVREVADDEDLNAEVREAMADTTIRICKWIDGMFERRDLRSRMKEEGDGGIIHR